MWFLPWDNSRTSTSVTIPRRVSAHDDVSATVARSNGSGSARNDVDPLDNDVILLNDRPIWGTR